MTGPMRNGRFGDFGGRLCPETFMPLDSEGRQYDHAKTDESFWEEDEFLWKHYVGRPQLRSIMPNG